jgi:hypothetical protein
MLASKKDDSKIKVIDWGTSRVYNPKKRMKKLVGTVTLLFLKFLIKIPALLHRT